MKYIDKLLEERLAKGDIKIWGGKITEEHLASFVSLWDMSRMPFIILETLGDIRVTRNSDYLEIDPYVVDRLRIFGEDGDLDIRRDSNIFFWRYIGMNSPPEGIEGKSFWDENPDKRFFMGDDECALLWGKYDSRKKLWHERRVASAKLSYPVERNPERVRVRYRTLSENGILAFVWFLAIKGDEADE
jgi:hypothetical protein